MSFHYLTLCRWQLKIGFRHFLKWHWITLSSKGGHVSLQLLLPRWQHIDQLLWKAEVDLENVEDMYLRLVFFRWELWPNPPESEVIVWSFQNLARDVFGSFLFHNTHSTEGMSRLEWNGWQAHRQPEGNLLLRSVIGEAELIAQHWQTRNL